MKRKPVYLMIGITIFLIPLIVSCSQTATPAPATQIATDTPVAPTETLLPDPTIEVVVVEEMWPQIQSGGVLSIGTSSGYPPFEYIDTQSFELSGFDIALIKEVGSRLGLQVEIRDMAFAGLSNALQLREINAAVAAISVTEDRLALFDFTNVYYVGTDGILAKQGAQVVVNRVEDLANFRVGVQNGSVYATWLQESLVDTGKMPPESLIRIDTSEELIQAMVSEPPVVDLLVLDLLPAEKAAAESTLEVVATGLNQQLYAIAVPKGETALLQSLNDALLQMQMDGTITNLATQYLGLEPEQLQPAPTPAPAPVVTPLPPPTGCLDSMIFVADLTYPDDIPYSWPAINPNEAVQKGWQIQNTGTCTWGPPGYELVYVGSEPPAVLAGGPVAIQASVPPGESTDIYVDVVAPEQAGQYVGYFNMRAPNGEFFGDRIWVAVEVGGSAPPAGQVPVIERFSIEPPVIQLGTCVEVDWVVSGPASEIQILANGQVIMANADPLGAFESCPESTGMFVYEILATGPGGTGVDQRSIEVQ